MEYIFFYILKKKEKKNKSVTQNNTPVRLYIKTKLYKSNFNKILLFGNI